MKLEKAKKFVSAVITCTLTAGALSSCAPAVTTQNTSISPKNIEWLNEINDIPASEKDMQLQTPEETIEMPVQDSVTFEQPIIEPINEPIIEPTDIPIPEPDFLPIDDSVVEPIHYSELDAFVQTDGNPLFYNDLCTILHQLPEGIKNCIVKNRMKIILMENENGAEIVYYGGYSGYESSVMGLTRTYSDGSSEIYVEGGIHTGYYDYQKNRLAIDAMSEYDFNYILARDTLIHEMGHFFDVAAGYGRYAFSDTDEFHQIHNNEYYNFQNTIEYNLDNMAIEQNISTTTEYFASAYSCYIAYPDNLRENCPQTYAYIDNIMRQIDMDYSQMNMEDGYAYSLSY